MDWKLLIGVAFIVIAVLIALRQIFAPPKQPKVVPENTEDYPVGKDDGIRYL